MSGSTEQRKLAAIMFTDMVGFSALSQRDETLALELLEEHRTIVRGLLPAHDGREVKTMGDGFLIEFSSALSAVQCAVEIQQALHERNQTAVKERKVRLRIGIHVGDVVLRDGDIHGDGVNIASRLEPLAAPGGICISEDVARAVRNKVTQPLRPLAATDLKNINLPIAVYRVILPWDATEPAPVPVEKRKVPSVPLFAWALSGAAIFAGVALAIWQPWRSAERPVATVTPVPVTAPTTSIPAVPDRKSIAVLPFTNMSTEAESAFFTDGMHEDIVTNLAVIRDLHVVSRTSVMQYRATTKPIRQISAELGVAYVLEGSVRRVGNKVRVTGQLINARTDEHVWAKSYDRDVTDVFAIQAELSQAIATALSAALSPQEKSLLENRPTSNPAAYDLFLKARAYMRGQAGELTSQEATNALLEAVKLDPSFAEAWALLSYRYAAAYVNFDDHSPEQLARAKSAIETAVRLAPTDPVVIEAQGYYHYYCYRDYARAAEQCRRLLLILPNSADAHGQLGLLYRRQGRWADALASLRQAGQLDPHHASWPAALGETLMALRHYAEAIPVFDRAQEIRSGSPASAVKRRYMVPLLARGSLREMDAWLASLPPDALNETGWLWIRRYRARLGGDWAQAVRMDQQHAYLDPYDEPHWGQDIDYFFDLIGNNELAAAKTRARKLIPELEALLEKQPGNIYLWAILGNFHALEGDKELALRCIQKAREILPESTDAVDGPDLSHLCAQVLAWTGDKDQALAELARLLRTPYGGNVYRSRNDPGWLPLRDDPRFEALLNDPQNNAPLY